MVLLNPCGSELELEVSFELTFQYGAIKPIRKSEVIKNEVYINIPLWCY